MDYIKREDAMERVNEWGNMYPDSDTAREALTMVMNELLTMPSADVVERKRGEWVYEFGKGAHCSICGKGCVWNFNYCPNCGADMRGNDK